MVSEWRTTTVQQLVGEGILERPLDGNHGEIHPKASDFVDRGIPFIMASDLVNGRVDLEHCAFISEVQAQSLRKGFSVPGDVLISHKATMGRTAIVGQLDVPFVILTPQVTYYRVKDSAQLCNQYLKLYFDSPSFQQLFNTWGQKGSTRAYLGITAQLELPVVLPPIREQRAIAHILGTLDDKIELNRRMSETLESIARALFKSWFVDFDPVRAKAEGRETGLPAHIAELFPDSFEDSELGEIPRGWSVKSLGDLLHLAYGKALKAENRQDGNVPVYGSNGQIGWHYQRLVAGPGIVVGRKGNPGIVTWIPGDFFPIDTTFYVVPKVKYRSLHFLYHALRGQDLATLGADSAVPGLNRNLAYMSDQVLPPEEILEVFDRFASNLSHRVYSLDQDSHTLRALRDTLLPKLISGEFRVNDAERIIRGGV